MKRFVSGLLMFLLAVTLFGCGAGPVPQEVAFTVTPEAVSPADPLNLNAEQLAEDELIITLPSQSELQRLAFAEDTLYITVAYQDLGWISPHAIQVKLAEPLTYHEVVYQNPGGDPLLVQVTSTAALAEASQQLGFDVQPTFIALAMTEDNQLAYYLQCSDGDYLNNTGDAVYRGTIMVSTKTGEILATNLLTTHIPGGHLSEERFSPAPQGRTYGDRCLLPQTAPGEFGPILTALIAETGDERDLLWDEQGLLWEGMSDDALGPVYWGTDETYFTTARPGPSYGDFYTHARLWRYDWQTKELALVSFLPEIDFVLSADAQKIACAGLQLDLAAAPPTATVSTPAALYQHRSPFTMLPGFAKVAAGPVQVLRANSDWVYVQQGETRGWLPQWYLSAEEVLTVSPASLVTKAGTQAYLYPAQAAPAILDLAAGRVVRVRKTCGDWSLAEMTVYNVPGAFWGWFRNADLATPDEMTPLEGHLPEGSPVFYSYELTEAQTPDYTTEFPMTVLIIEEKAGFLRLEAAGGWTAWTKAENVLRDPWQGVPLLDL